MIINGFDARRNVDLHEIAIKEPFSLQSTRPKLQSFILLFMKPNAVLIQFSFVFFFLMFSVKICSEQWPICWYQKVMPMLDTNM